MKRSLVRLATVCALALGATTLTGCLAASIPDTVPSPPPSRSVPAPEPSSGDDGTSSGPAESLTFDAGAALPSSTHLEWGDSMGFSDDYSVASPDDGAGNWSYTHVATGCTASFWQGTLASYDLSQGDSLVSDQILGQDFGETASEITPYASDIDVPQLGSGTVEMRAVSGSNDNASYVVIARGFAAVSSGLYFSLDCPTGQDAQSVFDEVRDDLSISLTPTAG